MFERIKYPDGQVGAKWVTGKSSDYLLMAEVSERINSYEDLFYVRAIADFLQFTNQKHWALFIPCLFGQRSDRRFTDDQSFDLKLIAEVINSCQFAKVRIFDPHSDVSLALINNSRKITSFEYVRKTISHILTGKEFDEGFDQFPRAALAVSNLVLVSPDAGAYKKVFDYGEKLNLAVMAAMKTRDLDGTVGILFTDNVKDKDCLIVDDLCDGGATFISLAKVLKLKGAKKIYLYVSHGIFSKGFDGLRYSGIDHIYCTNSVKDIDFAPSQLKEPFFTQFKII